ncbi:MAG: OmpA family protein [Sphingobacteriales bacterium]|nr:MAG: OmpA family protein [Sphingobacteriales bacterium]
MKNLRRLAAIVVAAGLLSSCSSMNKTQKGAVIGAGGGAVVGGAVGKAAGNTALGAIIGAAVGGTTGAVIGRRMDKQAQEIEKEVPGAKVERVGEGIVVEFGESVLFQTAQSTLTTASYNSLDKLTTILNKYPDTNLEIDGHTDSKGTDEYNQGLSERRAESVANYLVSRNINRTRVVTRGYGERYPKYSNNTEEGRAGNRRVEFQITANERMKEQAKQEAQN